MSAGSYERDDTFYLDDVIFLVENRLFKVPRRIFESGSHVFRDMFTMPQGGQLAAEGASDGHPLHLVGYKKVDFQRLLKVLLPRGVAGDFDLSTAEEWESVLKLAHIWGFDDVRAMAIDRLSALEMPPARRIALAREHLVQQWLRPALNDLARRERGLDHADVESLGLDWALKLARVREVDRNVNACQHILYCNWCNTRRAGSGLIVARDQFDFTPVIGRVFGDDVGPEPLLQPPPFIDHFIP